MSSSWHFPPPLSTIWFSNSWYFLDKKWNCSNPVDSQRLTGFEQLTRKIIIARMVSSNNKIVSSRFFEQSNFEQMIMTRTVVVIKTFFKSNAIYNKFCIEFFEVFLSWLMFMDVFFNILKFFDFFNVSDGTNVGQRGFQRTKKSTVWIQSSNTWKFK